MNNAIKQFCFDSDLITLYSQVVKSFRIHDYNMKNKTNVHSPFTYEQACYYSDYYFQDNDIRHQLNNILKANEQRRHRLNKRISIMLNYDCIFLTLTFTDDCLSSTSSSTRRQYVRRWLDYVSVLYVANIDFGSKNHREHYHAVILPNCDKIDYTSFGHGAVNGKRIHSSDNDDDCTRLSKYISKLSNHAIKETTKNHKIIYSRSQDFKEFLLN